MAGNNYYFCGKQIGVEELSLYLEAKKIDADALRHAEPAIWKDFMAEFQYMHPASFTAQKLFLINSLRRRYPFAKKPEMTLEESSIEIVSSDPKPKSTRPVMKIKPINKK